MNALGTFGDTPVLEVDGQVSYTFPNAPAPGVFRVDGHGKLIGIDFADVFAQYETRGKISFGGDVHLGDETILGISGGAEGEVDVNTLKFNDPRQGPRLRASRSARSARRSCSTMRASPAAWAGAPSARAPRYEFSDQDAALVLDLRPRQVQDPADVVDTSPRAGPAR